MNKYIKNTLKTFAIIIGLFVGSIGLYVGYLAYEWTEPFKVTDPFKTGFDPYKFEFDDYAGGDDRLLVMRKMFYVGMSREDVEKIIIGGGAHADMNNPHVKYGNPNEIWYVWINFWNDSIVFTFEYDENNKLVKALYRGSVVIVPYVHNPKKGENK